MTSADDAGRGGAGTFVLPGCGVAIAGVGGCAPPGVLTNEQLEGMMDTSAEWIEQRTGIRRRHVVDPTREDTVTVARDAMQAALDDAGMKATDLDLLILASVTSEMTCPSNACRVAAELGAMPAGAFDLVAACSGWVYGSNLADCLIRTGRYRTIGVVGCDILSQRVDYEERSVSILFGDGAGAAIFTRDDDPSRGCIYQTMNADGSNWHALYMPNSVREVPEEDRDNTIRIGRLRMRGREVFKFAVNKFREVIEDALERTGLGVDDVDHFICHQSNVRIIDAAKDRLGLPDEKVHVNIHEYGNTSAGSIGLVMNDLWSAGRVQRGQTIVFVAFGGGLTWSSSVWRV